MNFPRTLAAAEVLLFLFACGFLSLFLFAHKLGFIELDAVCLFSKKFNWLQRNCSAGWQAIGMCIVGYHSWLLWITQIRIYHYAY